MSNTTPSQNSASKPKYEALTDSLLKLESTLHSTKDISIILPTRGRGALLHKSLLTLIEKAYNITAIEFIIAVDNDDIATKNYVKNILVPDFDARNISLRVFSVPRFGYKELHKYINFLSEQAHGHWIIFWNDDAIMITDHWDKPIIERIGQFKLLAFKDNHGHPYSIFPILPRDWFILTGEFSSHTSNDAWVSQIAYICDIFERINVEVFHDRFDVTGNNHDDTFKEREILEGNPNKPGDFNYIDMRRRRMDQCIKINWYLNKIGGSNDWLRKSLLGEIDPWSKLFENDIGKNVHVE